jgi:creatinine amidohydrolase
MGIHGGSQETSLLLHLAPDLVDMTRAPRNVPAHIAANSYVRFGGPVKFGWLANDFGTSGVIGDATLASAATGAQLWEALVARLGEALAEVSRFSYSAPEV